MALLLARQPHQAVPASPRSSPLPHPRRCPQALARHHHPAIRQPALTVTKPMGRRPFPAQAWYHRRFLQASPARHQRLLWSAATLNLQALPQPRRSLRALRHLRPAAPAFQALSLHTYRVQAAVKFGQPQPLVAALLFRHLAPKQLHQVLGLRAAILAAPAFPHRRHRLWRAAIAFRTLALPVSRAQVALQLGQF